MRSIWRLRIHASWHIAAACIGVVAGVILAREWVYLPVGTISRLMTGIALIVFSTLDTRAPFIAVAILGGAVLGLSRGSI